jgi:hypothetical protein
MKLKNQEKILLTYYLKIKNSKKIFYFIFNQILKKKI